MVSPVATGLLLRQRSTIRHVCQGGLAWCGASPDRSGVRPFRTGPASRILLPTIASAQGRASAPRPTGVRLNVSLVCTGERGATAVISIENTGATPMTLVEVAPAFTFRDRTVSAYHLEVFMLIIPTMIGPGEILNPEVCSSSMHCSHLDHG